MKDEVRPTVRKVKRADLPYKVVFSHCHGFLTCGYDPVIQEDGLRVRFASHPVEVCYSLLEVEACREDDRMT